MELVEWQKIDTESKLVMCWWTHPFLDVMQTWDLKDATWLEFGAGLGTAWLRYKCKWVDTIESNWKWAEIAYSECHRHSLSNGIICIKQLADCAGLQNEYFDLIPTDKCYNYISVDGIYRTEAVEWSINHLKKEGGILVVDNLDQDFIWISPKAMELLAPYPCEIFIQPDHINHEGKPWNTRFYKIEKCIK